MKKSLLVLVAFATMAAMLYAGSAAAPATASTPASEHQRIIDFWTPARVAQAIPRDFVFDPTTGRFELKKPTNPGGGGGKPGGGGTSSDTTGSSWNGGGTVAKTTGKVLFAMDNSYWVCSASVVQESGSDQAVVLTAGHCVYDETNHQFATDWMFIPDYDATPVQLTASGSFCSETLYGCWTAQSLYVDSGFATANGFNQQATLNDVGIAVVGAGGLDNNTSVDSVGTQAVSFTSVGTGATVLAFGYPAAKRYKGTDLVYCEGPLGTDAYNNGLTYQLACDMTGGSSGGPWYGSFQDSSGTGITMSVNSYGYQGITAMYGPMFGSWTGDVYAAAQVPSKLYGNVVDVSAPTP